MTTANPHIELTQALSKIQLELKAPKSQFNKFGKYNYRNCEDILSAVKPMLNGLALTISDDIVAVGDRVYVKATVVISNGDTQISTSAFARESLDKKGMDAAQITGSASSYARKYALNGLFAIDDTKDADTNESAPEVSVVDVMGEIKMISDAATIEDLVVVWGKVSRKFKGKPELKDLVKHKDVRKKQLMGYV